MLMMLVIGQLFVCMVPARHFLLWLDDLAMGNFRGENKQPWLFVELPRAGRRGELLVSTLEPNGHLQRNVES